MIARFLLAIALVCLPLAAWGQVTPPDPTTGTAKGVVVAPPIDGNANVDAVLRALDSRLLEELGSNCTADQVVKADGLGGVDCADDLTGGGGASSIILDLDDGVGGDDSSALAEIAFTGAIDSVVTEPTADKLLFNFDPILFETELNSEAELEALLADVANVITAVELDSEAKLEALTGVDIVVSTERDTADEHPYTPTTAADWSFTTAPTNVLEALDRIASWIATVIDGTLGIVVPNVALDRDGDGSTDFILVTEDYDGTATGDTRDDIEAALDSLTDTHRWVQVAPGDYLCPDLTTESGCLVIEQDDVTLEILPGATLHGLDIDSTDTVAVIYLDETRNTTILGHGKGSQIDGGMPKGEKGTVTAFSNSGTFTITDDSQSWATNQWQTPDYGDVVVLRPRGPNREEKTITSNTADTLSFADAFTNPPVVGDAFYIAYDGTGVTLGSRMGINMHNAVGARVENVYIHDTTHACIYERNGVDNVIHNTITGPCGNFFAVNPEGTQPNIYTFTAESDSLRGKITENDIFDYVVGINSRSNDGTTLLYDYMIQGNNLRTTGTAEDGRGKGFVFDGHVDAAVLSNRVSGGETHMDFIGARSIVVDGLVASGQTDPGPSLQTNASTGKVTIRGAEISDLLDLSTGLFIITGSGTKSVIVEDSTFSGCGDRCVWLQAGWANTDGSLLFDNVTFEDCNVAPSNASSFVNLEAECMRFQGAVTGLHMNAIRIRGVNGTAIEFEGAVTYSSLTDIVIDGKFTTFKGVSAVSGLPGSPSEGDTAVVNDGSTGSDCTTGTGSSEVWCAYIDGTWTAVPIGNTHHAIEFQAANNDAVEMSGIKVYDLRAGLFGIDNGGAATGFTNSRLYDSSAFGTLGLSTHVPTGMIDLQGETVDAASLYILNAVCEGHGGSCVTP